jgi:hypothetical protein
MATPSVSQPAPGRHFKTLGVLVAGGILFAIGIGGPGALLGASTGATTEVASGN